jgi:hypothetical protein
MCVVWGLTQALAAGVYLLIRVWPISLYFHNFTFPPNSLFLNFVFSKHKKLYIVSVQNSMSLEVRIYL